MLTCADKWGSQRQREQIWKWIHCTWFGVRHTKHIRVLHREIFGELQALRAVNLIGQEKAMVFNVPRGGHDECSSIRVYNSAEGVVAHTLLLLHSFSFNIHSLSPELLLIFLNGTSRLQIISSFLIVVSGDGATARSVKIVYTIPPTF